MAYTQADLSQLQAAIAKGARKVRMGEEEVEFRSLKEMEKIEGKIKQELSGSKRSRIVRVGTHSEWR